MPCRMPIQVSRRRLYQTVAVMGIGGGLIHISVLIVSGIYGAHGAVNIVGNIVSALILVSLGSFFAYKSRTMPDQTITLCANGAEQMV